MIAADVSLKLHYQINRARQFCLKKNNSLSDVLRTANIAALQTKILARILLKSFVNSKLHFTFAMNQLRTQQAPHSTPNPVALAGSGTRQECTTYKQDNHVPSPRCGPNVSLPERGTTLSPRGADTAQWEGADKTLRSPFTDRIPVERLRTIWNDKDITYPDCELLTIRDWLYTMAEIINEVINSPGFRAPGGWEKENQHHGRHRIESPRTSNPRNNTNGRHPSEPPV